ncbi:MAG: BREX-1 system adenine-specific DNA-methyltransferase PglX [Candidatus Nitrotoga sp.]
MKLSEHVKVIRELIHTAFVNQFARLLVTADGEREAGGLDAEARDARAKLDAIIASHVEETGSYNGAYTKALDEYTFTLFNRLAALKVMEAHRMFPEVVTKRPENGGRSFGHRAWLEQNPQRANEELEGLFPYIRSAFDSLADKIQLYSKDSTYDLLPYVLDLNAIIGAVNAVEEDADVGVEIWLSDDIMGWLYESYNLAKKQAFKDSGDKIEFDKVSLTSQVYTPKWVVEFLVNNSLGKLYLEMYPDSEIKRQYKIANVPATRVRTLKSLHELRLIDPATGSANFLLYAFDFFYALYVDQIENYGEDYDEDDIPKLIVENNLYGVDLDDRAIQIAQLGLYIKALRKNSRVHIDKFNVVSSDFYLPDFEVVADSFSGSLAKDPQQKQLVKDIWADLQRAYQFGSLIRVEERFNSKFTSLYENMKATQLNLFVAAEYESLEKFKGQFFKELHNAVSAYSQSSGNGFLQSKTNDAITFLEILTQKYDVAVANPPYTDSGDYGGELKRFIEDNYKKPYAFHTNLYATFIKRCVELINSEGKMAMLHPLTFMFIKSFEGVREYIISNLEIEFLAELGLGGVFQSSEVQVDAVMYVLGRGGLRQDGTYFNLRKYKNHSNKPSIFEGILADYLNSIPNKHIYSLNQDKFKVIKSCPFIYWISDAFREKFGIKNSLVSKNEVISGIKTGNNNAALRFWWEVDRLDISEMYSTDHKKWIRYAKGGPFNKWYGNNWLCVDWANDAKTIRSQKSFNIVKEKYRFRQCIPYSGSGSKGITFRILDEGSLFDMGNSAIFAEVDIYALLAVLNSKLSFYAANCLNPTVNKQPNDVERLPLPKNTKSLSWLSPFAKRNVLIKKHLCSFSLIEMVFSKSPICFTEESVDIRERISIFCSYENHLMSQILLNEAIINKRIFEIYELPYEDKAMVLAEEGESIGSLPLLPEARFAYLAEAHDTFEFPLDGIYEFIEALPTRSMTDQEIADISAKFDSLYQGNNDLEEFCISNQINPINVWHLFQKSGVLPAQRTKTIAMEFLTDLIREILKDDDDGIVPLVRNAGEEILIDRIEKQFEEKGLSSAHFSAFPAILGKEINEYINKDFFAEFSNHLNLFKQLPMTPFIWHITSGPRQGFDAYIIIYKWNRDRLFTLKSVYIEKRETALRNRQSDLLNEKSAQAEAEKDLIFHQLKEIDSLKKKIDELLSEGYDPKLDDGVGKNIAPLQKKGILAYDVLNAGQLKKYLNADW